MAVGRLTGNARQLDLVAVLLLSPSAKDRLSRRRPPRFEVRVIKQLDSSPTVTAFRRSYPPSRSESVPPGLEIHGCAACVYLNREFEFAEPVSVLFCSICAKYHPDRGTTAGSWRRVSDRVEGLSLQRLPPVRMAVKLEPGGLELTFTGVHAEVCPHSEQSHEPTSRREAWMESGAAGVMPLGEESVSGELPDGMEIPGELGRRGGHLARSAVAGAMTEGMAGIRQLRRYAGIGQSCGRGGRRRWRVRRGRKQWCIAQRRLRARDSMQCTSSWRETCIGQFQIGHGFATAFATWDRHGQGNTKLRSGDRERNAVVRFAARLRSRPCSAPSKHVREIPLRRNVFRHVPLRSHGLMPGTRPRHFAVE